MSGARALGDDFLKDLKEGMLSGITRRVIEDRDLILEFRGDYINVYFKGHNLVAIRRSRTGYVCTASEKFVSEESELGSINEDSDCEKLLACFGERKNAIARHRSYSNEIEQEQMLIRANNYETGINSEYFILDRQFMESKNREAGRPDMLGVFWPRAGRSRNREVPLVVFELKYALNPDIAALDEQVSRYYTWLEVNGRNRAVDLEKVLQQKLELGIFDAQGVDRAVAMRDLSINGDPTKAEIAIVLSDYNPYSRLLNIDKLKTLPFADRIRIMHVGFGLWNVRSETLHDEQRQTTTS